MLLGHSGFVYQERSKFSRCLECPDISKFSPISTQPIRRKSTKVLARYIKQLSNSTLGLTYSNWSFHVSRWSTYELHSGFQDPAAFTLSKYLMPMFVGRIIFQESSKCWVKAVHHFKTKWLEMGTNTWTGLSITTWKPCGGFLSVELLMRELCRYTSSGCQFYPKTYTLRKIFVLC